MTQSSSEGTAVGRTALRREMRDREWKHRFFSKNQRFSPCSAFLKGFNTRRSDDFTNLNLIQTMAKALSKSQIAASVAEKAQISKKTASEILDHLADLAYKNAKNSFTLPGI